jgi:succinate dehydrogenase / fumarate reductase iron-sulfur subunit
MSIQKITFRILRYKPGLIDPPQFRNFSIEVKPEMTILDGLEKIRLAQDATLMYRHSCHHSSCGTCACKINGTESLACTTKIKNLKSISITLAPLDGFRPIGDLVVDISPLFKNISEEWSYLKNSENVRSSQMPEEIKEFKRFENCIECGACISACPVTRENMGFFGPAALAALSNELKKSPQKAESLLSMAGNKNGERLCERALNCSRVCPTGVYPARHIADLARLLEKKIQKKLFD